MQNILLLKVMYFWFEEVKDAFAAFPEVVEELLFLLEKLSQSRHCAELLKGHKIMKGVLALSKDALIDPKLKRTALQVVRNVTGKGGMNHLKPQSSYIPTSLAESGIELTNL